MNRKLMISFLVLLFVLVGVFAVYLIINNGHEQTPATTETPAADETTDNVGLANPASVYCQEQGGALEIRTEEGGQIGYCKFSDNSECEEWAFFRKECQVGDSLKPAAEVIINSPTINEIVSSPLTVKGQASGGWFFEGNAPIKLLDGSGKVIAESFVTAKGDWMTDGPVSFEGEIIFNVPTTAEGTFVFMNDNPSDLRENDKKFEVPVKFSTTDEKMTVKVFFPNTTKDPEMLDCSKVYPVAREIDKTEAVGQAALEQLLSGLTESEKTQGYINNIKSGVKLNKLTIADGVATADFNKTLDENVGGSCMVASIAAQIKQTLMQFSTVKNVIISIDGRTEDILQP